MASKRARCAKWADTETVLLAKLKRDASLRGEVGSHVWHEISRSTSGKTALQCRRRWETLVKVYNHVQDHCTQTGYDHKGLDDAELASMKLNTAYRREWYIIVEEVCSERRRSRVCDQGAAAMLSKGSSTSVMESFPTTSPAKTDSSAETLAEDSASRVSEGTITKESSDNSILEVPVNTKSECLDLEAASKVIELGVRLCCTGCKKRLTKKILNVDGEYSDLGDLPKFVN